MSTEPMHLAQTDATWALRTPSIWESPDERSIPILLAAIGQVLADLTTPTPAAPSRRAEVNGEGLAERDWIAELADAHHDSYPMGNIHHGTEERPDWGTFCVECKQSWPCDVSRLLDALADREPQ